MEHQLLLLYAYEQPDEGQDGAQLQAGHTTAVAIHREDYPPGCFMESKVALGRPS